MLLKSSHGIIQGYNANAMVDAQHQVIVHAQAFGEGDDGAVAEPMLAGAQLNLAAAGCGKKALTKAAVSADTGYGAAWQGLGAALVATDGARATAAWQRAVAIEPRNYDALFNLGIVLSERPAPQEALPYLKRFVAEAPRDRYSRDIARGAALISRIERR